MNKEDIERRLEEIFGEGSRQEIKNATTNEKIAERIEEMSRRENQLDILEEMRRVEEETEGGQETQSLLEKK